MLDCSWLADVVDVAFAYVATHIQVCTLAAGPWDRAPCCLGLTAVRLEQAEDISWRLGFSFFHSSLLSANLLC